MPIKLRGAVEMRARLADARVSKPAEILEGMNEFAEIVVTRAKGPDETPVLTGTLRNTIHNEGAKADGRGRFTVEIAAGGPSAPYARKVHEDLTMRHPRGGKAKYLEDPFNQTAPEALSILASHVKVK